MRSFTVGQLSEFMQRVWAAARQFSRAALERLAEMPVHCYRCHTEYKLGEGKLGPLSSIREHRGTLHFFCHECKEALLAEYCYRCSDCGDRHNLANSSLCAFCLSGRLPKEAKRVTEHRPESPLAIARG